MKRCIMLSSILILLACAMMVYAATYTATRPSSSQQVLQGILQQNAIPFPIIASTQLKNGTIIALKTNCQLFKSIDNGLTWQNIPQNDDVEGKLYATDKDTLLAITGKGQIIRSTTGTTWTPAYSLAANESIWMFFEDTNYYIYATVYSFGDTKEHAKLLKSTNDGVSWQQIAYWPGYRHCHDVFVNKFNGYIYVSLGDGPFALMRSKDSGTTWTNLYSDVVWTNINGKGESNQIYISADARYAKICRFADNGDSTITVETLYDHSGIAFGYCYWMQVVSSKLMFGTVEQYTGYIAGFGISNDNWDSFNMIYQVNTTIAWTGFSPCTRSYWNITRIFIADTTQQQPSVWSYQPITQQQYTITFMPFNMTFTTTTQPFTVPDRITMWNKEWIFKQWQDGDTNSTKTLSGTTIIVTYD